MCSSGCLWPMCATAGGALRVLPAPTVPDTPPRCLHPAHGPEPLGTSAPAPAAPQQGWVLSPHSPAWPWALLSQAYPWADTPAWPCPVPVPRGLSPLPPGRSCSWLGWWDALLPHGDPPHPRPWGPPVPTHPLSIKQYHHQKYPKGRPLPAGCQTTKASWHHSS